MKLLCGLAALSLLNSFNTYAQSEGISYSYLTVGNESINYKELIYKPTTIVGIAANNGVIGSILGLIITGCLLAVQGFVTTGIEYDAIGWFNF